MSHSALEEIYGFRAIGKKLGTAGQPTEHQFRAIQAAGFKAVVNLALPTSDHALPHEGAIVNYLGMSYVHIPIDFRSPTARDFKFFCQVMDALGEQPVFVHCAANMRVSAFVFLYRVLRLKVPQAEAEVDLHALWRPEGVWAQFIQEQLDASR